MGKTYRRPPIKQHRQLEEAKYRGQTEEPKKLKPPKYPSQDISQELFDHFEKNHDHNV